MNEVPNILLVEDEDSLAIGLEFNLNEEGYRVTRAEDGRKAVQLADSQDFDLVILDIMLPYLDGFQVAEHIRQSDPRKPILMLTARTEADDRVKGLSIGADDYITKPFHLEELLLRVKGMLRRKKWYAESTASSPQYRFGENEIDFKNLRGRCGQKEMQFTTREVMVMKYLIEHTGQVVSRSELLENVWNISSDVETRTVDNFIVRLRRYFEPDPEHPVYIKSVRGVGYIFESRE